MRTSLFLIALILVGCSSVSENVKKVQNFSKCYIEKIPAPFWVCFQSTFMSVGKVYTPKPSRLKQEEAYSIAINDLITKIQIKTKLFLQKLNIKNEKILNDVKNFVIVNALEGKSWYDKKNHILYVQAYIDKDEFKEFLKNKINIKDFEKYFNETF